MGFLYKAQKKAKKNAKKKRASKMEGRSDLE
jgi:hypothetical protein